jgi:hypothetical protein
LVPGRPEAEALQAKVMTEDEAGRIAANIAKLPALLHQGRGARLAGGKSFPVLASSFVSALACRDRLAEKEGKEHASLPLGPGAAAQPRGFDPGAGRSPPRRQRWC